MSPTIISTAPDCDRTVLNATRYFGVKSPTLVVYDEGAVVIFHIPVPRSPSIPCRHTASVYSVVPSPWCRAILCHAYFPASWTGASSLHPVSGGISGHSDTAYSGVAFRRYPPRHRSFVVRSQYVDPSLDSMRSTFKRSILAYFAKRR